jgi:hypothetical protein
MGGKTSYGTTTGQSTAAPWSPQQPYIQQGFQQAANQLSGGSTVAPFSPQTQQGLNMTTQTAANSQLPQSAASFLSSLLGGSWGGAGTSPTTGSTVTPMARPTLPSMAGMSPDQRRAAMADYRAQQSAFRSSRRASLTAPGGAGSAATGDAGGMSNAYIDQLANSIGYNVVPQVMSNFGMAGRSGASPLAQTAVGEGIASALAPYMFGSAENAQNRLFQGGQNAAARQMQGLAMAPAIAGAEYGPANAMLGVGGAIDAKVQQSLDNPAQLLANYMNIVGQPFGSQTSSSGVQPIDHQSAFAPLRILGK